LHADLGFFCFMQVQDITDVFIGKAASQFAADAVLRFFCALSDLYRRLQCAVVRMRGQGPENCFSVVSRSRGVQLDLEARSRRHRDLFAQLLPAIAKDRAIKVQTAAA
jgi:hypothetical protein